MVALEASLVLVIDLKADVNVVFRPYITEFLETAAVYFNVTVVSAISRSIAEKIVAHVDPSGKLIKKRVWLRQATGDARKTGLGDLVLGNLDRAHTLVVRNTYDACLRNDGCELEIPPWNNDQSDRALVDLAEQVKDIAVSRTDNLEALVKRILCEGGRKAGMAQGTSGDQDSPTN